MRTQLLDEDQVTFGYLPDFYYDSEPAVVFIGSSEGLTSFRDFLKNIAIEMPQYPVCLNKLSFFQAMKDTTVWLSVGGLDCSAKRIQASAGNEIRWVISPNDSIRFSNLINELVESEIASHQYLDCEKNHNLNIIVSKGEYTNKIFE